MLGSTEFDLWADGYDKSVSLSDDDGTYPFAGYKDVLAHIYTNVRKNDSMSILDIGCGTAVLTSRLYDCGCDVTAIDFSERMLEIALSKMPQAELIRYDFSRGLPPELTDRSFDAIICTYALHHLTHDGKIAFLHELRGHLNRGGLLLIGDISFATRIEHDECMRRSGDDWDSYEVYFVYDELRSDFPNSTYAKLSHCAGVLEIKGE